MKRISPSHSKKVKLICLEDLTKGNCWWTHSTQTVTSRICNYSMCRSMAWRTGHQQYLQVVENQRKMHQNRRISTISLLFSHCRRSTRHQNNFKSVKWSIQISKVRSPIAQEFCLSHAVQKKNHPPPQTTYTSSTRLPLKTKLTNAPWAPRNKSKNQDKHKVEQSLPTMNIKKVH